ncbi:MAG: hypothetical protein AB7T63_15595 [Planctomycetota bacterium]
MSKRVRASRSWSLAFLVPGAVVVLTLAGCGGGGSDDEMLVLGGTKAREGVAGGGSATVANTLAIGDNGLNSGRVALLSFSLQDLPSGAEVESATLGIHQLDETFGTPYADLGVVVVDSVDLGAGVDGADAASAALIPLLGTLSTSVAPGERTLDVTAAVLADVAALRTRSEFRIRFFLATDGDGQQDTVQIRETGGSGSGAPPTLVVVYRP